MQRKIKLRQVASMLVMVAMLFTMLPTLPASANESSPFVVADGMEGNPTQMEDADESAGDDGAEENPSQNEDADESAQGDGSEESPEQMQNADESAVDFGSEANLYQMTLASDFAGGDGSEDDPYQIENAEQLNKVRNHLDKHFILVADIDLGDAPYNTGEGWVPIGSFSEDTPFTGSFDGNEHTIKNLFISSSTDGLGLFGSIKNATIKNVELQNVDINGTGMMGRVGALAGYSTDSQILNISKYPSRIL